MEKRDSPKLRSILRCHLEKNISNDCTNTNSREKDSDYTGDDEESESESKIDEKKDDDHFSSSLEQRKDQITVYNFFPNQKSSTTATVTFANDSTLTHLTMKTTNPGANFHPVYVPPLKYRPLLGLSANDNRLLFEKRVSLLGKPFIYHPIQKRSYAYRRRQLLVYNFLERAEGYKALIYHIFVFFTVFLCLFLSVIVTLPEYEKIATTVLLPSEMIVFIWLSIELSLRIWSAGCRSRYQTLIGRLKFLRKPFCALDFIVILATFLTLCLNIRNGGNGVFAASALRGLRFFQILRMLRMDRRGGTWKLLGSVVYAHRQELITTIYIGFLVWIFSSFLMFLIEKDQFIIENNSTNLTRNFLEKDRHKFETFADALWWGIITLCTVGYGDKVPSSYIGKLLAAICSFIGISFFALPAGILGSGFALKVQQQQRQKHYKRRKIPAVLLIQNLWRVYAADEKSLSQATWKVYVKNQSQTSIQINENSNLLKHRSNQSFLNRVSFRRRPPTTNSNSIRSCVDAASDTTSIHLAQDLSSSENEDENIFYANDVQSLTSVHRNAIRFIRKVKFFVARRKFREALRPYDVTDVIEQYSTGNMDMLARMKYLQARLDKVLGISKSSDSYESGPSLASRICKIEQQVDELDFKIARLCQLSTRFFNQQDSLTPIIINRYRSHHFLRRRRIRPPPPIHQNIQTN